MTTPHRFAYMAMQTTRRWRLIRSLFQVMNTIATTHMTIAITATATVTNTTTPTINTITAPTINHCY